VQDHAVSRAPATNPWLCYDTVAESYERVAVPSFEPMARDLLRAVAPAPGASVLDVGTGTGLVAGLARTERASADLTVGIDPSTGMLDLARSHRGIVTGAAQLPGLPFADATFDVVVANLVISHVPDIVAGLIDMVRVLRPRGRLGVTAWAPDLTDPDDQSAAADAIVASARHGCGLPSQAPVQGAPWEEHLRDRAWLVSLFADAGLRQIEVGAHTYRRDFVIDGYLSGWGGLGRYLRWKAGDTRWQAFSDLAASRLRQRFGDSIVSVKRAWVATGTAA
jgi:SAM-dependent methyltransferase